MRKNSPKTFRLITDKFLKMEFEAYKTTYEAGHIGGSPRDWLGNCSPRPVHDSEGATEICGILQVYTLPSVTQGNQEDISHTLLLWDGNKRINREISVLSGMGLTSELVYVLPDSVPKGKGDIVWKL